MDIPFGNHYNIMSNKETKELLSFLFDIADGVKESVSNDNKITIADAPNFLKSAINSSKALAGINEIPQELAQMTEAEAAEVRDFIKERFDYVADAEVEIIYESLVLHGIGVARNLLRLYSGGLSQSSAS